ncbi:hypothetical protein LTR84_009309 [Exophiala bonariae]|uniref:DUF6536 domain-containing protein n=1 Tax=Exophiala bonariae TaxID=1690606 RepID=A0AAV9MX36_9EURO|nr:hypothetical protein LTR84_009309 [Exophiala bonariae]
MQYEHQIALSQQNKDPQSAQNEHKEELVFKQQAIEHVDDNPRPPPSHRNRISNWKRTHASGWRFGVIASASCAILVLLTNIILILWVSWSGPKLRDGIAPIYSGSCARVKDLNFWLHLLINALGKYNSTIFINKGANAYSVYPTTLDYLNGPLFSTYDTETEMIPNLNNEEYLQIRDALPLFERLEIAECIKAYGSQFISKRGDVIPILSTDTAQAGLDMAVVGRGIPTIFRREATWSWMCMPVLDPGSNARACPNLPSAEHWQIILTPPIRYLANWTTVDGASRVDATVTHCLSRPSPELCKLEFSLYFMAAVIVCNFIKATAMIITLYSCDEMPLVTLGDAIASFLAEPDPVTSGNCLLSKEELGTSEGWYPRARAWKATRRRWFNSASKKRWMLCNILYLATIAIALYLLIVGLRNLKDQNATSTSLRTLWDIGFGTANVKSLIAFDSRGNFSDHRILTMALVANLPQLLLSFVYLTYNGLFTCMLSAQEWNNMGIKRKGLRVSVQSGDQRSTHFLSLPKSYAVPLMLFSGLLHWMVSQSIFLVYVTVYDGKGNVSSGFTPQDLAFETRITTCGYSAIAILFSISVGSIAVVVLNINGYRRLESGIPPAAACSAVISAACHRPEDDTNAATLPIKWGVVRHKGDAGPWHCCLTSQEVDEPIDG